MKTSRHREFAKNPAANLKSTEATPTRGGDYLASLVLLDDLWADIADTVEAAIVAEVPSPDVLLLTGSKYPEGRAAIRKAVDKIMATGGYLASTTMLRRHGDAGKVFPENSKRRRAGRLSRTRTDR